MTCLRAYEVATLPLRPAKRFRSGSVRAGSRTAAQRVRKRLAVLESALSERTVRYGMDHVALAMDSVAPIGYPEAELPG